MAELATQNPRPRILSGMRPTGKLHLGNYMGALANWVKLQNDYDCYFFIADLHALTTDYADTSGIAPNMMDVALDFLAAGLDPAKCTIFVQSAVRQHAELSLLLGMITPLGWLERVPTFKEQQEQLSDRDLNQYGFLGYPLLMTVDIVIMKANIVPVGKDQKQHLEITRDIAVKFKHPAITAAQFKAMTQTQAEGHFRFIQTDAQSSDARAIHDFDGTISIESADDFNGETQKAKFRIHPSSQPIITMPPVA